MQGPRLSDLNYVTRVHASPADIPADHWNRLLQQAGDASPFMRHEYLLALHEADCATPAVGWHAQFLSVWREDEMVAACPLYGKDHSYGEYVFDWAWANAYAQHGLKYYPKGLVAVPFTPVPGARLLATDRDAKIALVQALLAHASVRKLSSLHLLFLQPDDVEVCREQGLMLRHTVQFHWTNRGVLDPSAPLEPPEHGYTDFDDFLTSLQQEKRKKIRQERRKVAEAGVTFRWMRGTQISTKDWDFFYRCYERTYLEHGNAPYLTRDFFHRMQHTMPDNWLLFVGQRHGQDIACSLIGIDPASGVAYGRYWGALERVDCLHFEACYYQPLAWCIEHSYRRFEGGAQGEHKMARALLPVKTTSAHWLAHPAFADAVERFLEREGQGIEQYVHQLEQHSPMKRTA